MDKKMWRKTLLLKRIKTLHLVFETSVWIFEIGKRKKRNGSVRDRSIFIYKKRRKCDGLKTGMNLMTSDGPLGRPFGRLGP